MRMTPSGVVTSMRSSRAPPTRTSMAATEMLAPAGPYHAAKCSGSAHNFQITPGGASNVRSITRSCAPLSPVMVNARLSLLLEWLEVGVHPVEPRLPDRPVLLGPRGNLLERCRVQATRPVLRVLTSDNQPGSLEHLDVLGDSRK